MPTLNRFVATLGYAVALFASWTFSAGAQQAPAPAPDAGPAAGSPKQDAVDSTLHDGTRFLFQTSLYGSHWSPDPDHNNRFRLINLEAQRRNDWLYGLAFFHNSFDQPTQYAYFGKQWFPFASYPLVHVKLTGGIIHGYKGEYRDKIPLNGNGIAPGILPSIGVSGKRFSSDLIFFGTAGVMITVGIFIN